MWIFLKKLIVLAVDSVFKMAEGKGWTESIRYEYRVYQKECANVTIQNFIVCNGYKYEIDNFIKRVSIIFFMEQFQKKFWFLSIDGAALSQPIRDLKTNFKPYKANFFSTLYLFFPLQKLIGNGLRTPVLHISSNILTGW